MSETEQNYALDHTLKVKKADLDIVQQTHEYDLNLSSNQIFLFGAETYTAGSNEMLDLGEPGIEYVIANRFIRNLNLCMRINSKKPILIHMKTCGGFWTEGMAIYDAIKSCPNPVTILSYTHARSMSSLILQAANKRVLMPNSYFMIHDGTDYVSGTQKSVRSYVDFGRIASKTMLDIYVKSLKENGKFKNKSEKVITNWLKSKMNEKEEVYLTAKESVEIGFADEIFDANWAKLLEYTEEQLRR
jgi:ATP-dependent protease ClpP protease subunit